MITKHEVIIDFIKQFQEFGDNVTDCFSHGMCYYFASILQERFGANIMYEPVMNHFAGEIDGYIYDITGFIANYTDPKWYYWETYQHEDALHTERILRDCVYKLRLEEE